MTPVTIFDMTGKIALITGGAGALGGAMASALAGAGASLVLVDADQSGLERVAGALRADGTEVLGICEDVTSPTAPGNALRAILARFGRIDVLVCAAGRALRKDGLASDDVDYDAVMAVNIKAVFQWNRAFGRQMVEQRRGAIINVASQGAFAVLRKRPLYNTSKAAVVQLTRSLAADWIEHGVRVNAIAPGLMDTPFIAELKADTGRITAERRRIPAGRLGRPDDLAGAVLLLASDAGEYIVGHTLIVDGGWTLC